MTESASNSPSTLAASLASLTQRLLGTAIAVLVAGIAVEELGLRRYGVWAVIGAAATYVNLVDFGLGPAVMRATAIAAQDPADRRSRSVLGAAIALSAVAGAVVIAIGIPVAWVAVGMTDADIRVDARGAALFVVAIGALSFGSSVVAAILTGLGRAAAVAKVTSIAQVVFAVCVVVVLTTRPSMSGLASIYLLQLVVTIGLQLDLLRRVAATTPLASLIGRPSRQGIRDIVRFGAGLQASVLADIAVFRSSQVATAGFATAREAALVDVGQRGAGPARVFVNSLTGPLTPALVRATHGANPEARAEALRRVTRLVFVGSFGLFTLVAALERPLATAWLGPQGTGAGRYMVLASGAVLLNNVLAPMALLMRAEGSTRIEGRYSVVLIVAHVLGLALVARFGPYYVMGSALAASAIGALYFVTEFRRQHAGALRDSVRGWCLRLTVGSAILTAAGQVLFASVGDQSRPAAAASSASGLVVLSLAFALVCRWSRVIEASDAERVASFGPARLRSALRRATTLLSAR